jgi:Family of unknown function (DUF6065)
MPVDSATITIVPLVPNVRLPRVASARTRPAVPSGYGVREQCLPFTAASALGVVVLSPIRFGLCRPDELPLGCRAFRSPLEQPDPCGRFADPRMFYVFDEPDCGFSGNAYHLIGDPRPDSCESRGREPGLSFFDRKDQQNLFKLHLPYIWRTSASVDSLFLPPLNRSAHGFGVACGLVETEWYASPVNPVLGKPPGSVHVTAGDPIAQVILVPRSLRRSTLEVAPAHSHINTKARGDWSEWNRQLTENRSAYKMLARSRHGRVEGETSAEPGGANSHGGAS